jgi:hypothetical protein
MTGYKILENRIRRINGIAQYLIVEENGNIAAHNMTAPEKTGEMIFFCGRSSHDLGRNRFRFLVFSRKNKKNLFIFPAGRYYLGVIKDKNTDTTGLVRKLMNLLEELN